MSKRLQSGQQSLSGLPQPLVEGPSRTIIAKRDPTADDTGYPLSQTWLNKTTQQYFILSSVSGGVATWQILSGGAGSIQFDPDTGANVSPVAGIVTIPGFGGIETLNGGAGILQVEDRRWLSSFVVDPSAVVGQRGTFTTIQAAINAAVAGDVIFVRPGTYVENLTLKAGVDIFGVAVDGRIPNPIVSILGNHSFTTDGFVALQGISFSAAAGTVFTLTGAPGVTPIIALKFSRVDSPIGSAGVLTGGGGGAAFILFGSEASAQFATFILTDGSVQVQESSSSSSNTAECFQLNGNSSVMVGAGCDANGNAGCVVINSAGSSFQSENATLFSGLSPCIQFNAAGSATALDTIMRSNNPAGFYVAGAGTYGYAGDIATDSARNIDPATTKSAFTWRPFAESAPAAVGSTRGTASFDSAQFTITDGFVQLFGPGGVGWSDYPVSAAAPANSGALITGVGVTVSLPNTPANGTIFECVVANGNSPAIIQSTGVNVIQVGTAVSAGPGTATSTANGDSLKLVYQTTGNTWYAIGGTEGTWVVV